MTLRQFLLLDRRHRDELVHREMCAAFTTAAVINYGYARPRKPTAPADWMPNWAQGKAAEQPFTPEQNKAISDSTPASPRWRHA